MASSGTSTTRRGGTPRPAAGRSAPRLHLGRLVVLVLVLVAAAFYVAPLRSFFEQQDRYQHGAAALAAARADNATLKHQIELLTTRTYVAQKARTDSMLVPPGTQVFVIKGLPGREQERAATPAAEASVGSFSVLDRVEDLWRTLLH